MTGSTMEASVAQTDPAELTETHQMIWEIVLAEGSEQIRARDEFIESRGKLFRNIAFRLCRNFGIQKALHLDDVVQIVAMEAVAWVDELIAEPKEINKVVNWEGMLHVRARASVRAWNDMNLSPASGMISVSRRVRALNQLRDEMRSTGNEPTDREVVEAHNEKMRATRKDPARQGMLATVDDLHLAATAADIDDHDRMGPMEDGCLLHPAEGPEFVKSVVEAAAGRGETVARVAAVWLSGVYSGEGAEQVLTVAEVASELKISRSTASAHIRFVKGLARTILADDLGITHA